MTSNFLWYPGASNNTGLLASALTVLSTETAFSGLTNTSIVLSGSSGAPGTGIFTNANTGQAIFGDVFFVSGGAITPSGVPVLSGWFIVSPDGGTTWEAAGATPPRPPDFVIPLPTSVASGAIYKSQSRVILPALQFKVLLQNNATATLGTGNTIKIAPFATQY